MFCAERQTLTDKWQVKSTFLLMSCSQWFFAPVFYIIYVWRVVVTCKKCNFQSKWHRKYEIQHEYSKPSMLLSWKIRFIGTVVRTGEGRSLSAIQTCYSTMLSIYHSTSPSASFLVHITFIIHPADINVNDSQPS